LKASVKPSLPQDEWWQYLLHTELSFDHPEPDWFDEPAIGRLTVTSARDIKTFKAYNTGRGYPDQVKPWGFLCIAYATPYERARPDGPGCLIGPFERDPERRRLMTWIDRDHAERGVLTIHTGPSHEIRDGSVHVLRYRDYYDKYIQHPEAKALDPRDRQPCHTWTRGLLAPRASVATILRRVGKESNRLTDNSELPIEDESNRLTEYPPATRECRGCAERVSGRRRWCSDACRKRYARAHDNPPPRQAQP